MSVASAETAVHDRHGIKRMTLLRMRQRVEGMPRDSWLPLLAADYHDGGKRAEFTEDAKAWIQASFLNQSKTKVNVLISQAKKKSRREGLGWVIPSENTVRRFLAQTPAPPEILGRMGPKALEASYPTVRKDYENLAVHELWESDGHRADVWCKWPDGKVARPFVVVWRDVRSRLVLCVKGYLNPCAELSIVSLADAIRNVGLKPMAALLDSGMEYAAKVVTGGQATRYRFKVRAGEPVGVLTHLDINVKWAKPGRGRDKPIERFWGHIADYVDQSPEFAGAYTGNSPVTRPDECDKARAVRIEDYARAVGEACHDFNASAHSGNAMNGRTPQEVYDVLRPGSVGRPVADAHFRLLKMGLKELTPSKIDASVEVQFPGFGMHRFWSKEFAQLPLVRRQKRYAVWYHPSDPNAGISLYDEERFVCDMPIKERLPFSGAGQAAKDHADDRASYIRRAKAERKAIGQASPAALPAPASHDGPSLMLVHSKPAVTAKGEVGPPTEDEAQAVIAKALALAEMREHMSAQRRAARFNRGEGR